MSPNKPSSPLLAGLKQENTAWQALLQVMQDEEQALIAGDTERLALLGTAKLTQLQSVSEHVQNRHTALQAAGQAVDQGDRILARDRRRMRLRQQRLLRRLAIDAGIFTGERPTHLLLILASSAQMALMACSRRSRSA